mmetsp:Transcript_72148/g.207167  ORF Transcript_72148/g.207167 Transcript_72148/m.207167 type:complete len:90 (+) Transcript_72148:108-377(+)
MAARALYLPNRRKGQKYVTLDDLAFECGCVINLGDTVASLKQRLSAKKFCPIQNIKFSITGKDIPNESQLKEYFDMHTRFLLTWHSPMA